MRFKFWNERDIRANLNLEFRLFLVISFSIEDIECVFNFSSISARRASSFEFPLYKKDSPCPHWINSHEKQRSHIILYKYKLKWRNKANPNFALTFYLRCNLNQLLTLKGTSSLNVRKQTVKYKHNNNNITKISKTFSLIQHLFVQKNVQINSKSETGKCRTSENRPIKHWRISKTLVYVASRSP